MARSILSVVLAALLTAGLCLAEGPEGGAPPRPADLLDRRTLTDDWLGAGRELAERGVRLNLGLTQVYQLNLDGGLATHRRSGRWAGSYDLVGEFDLEKLFSLPGARIYVSAEGSWSDGLDASSIGSVGGFRLNDDAVGDRPINVTRFYYEQALAGRRLRIRLGKLDLTDGFQLRGLPVAFDTNAFADDERRQFLNTALVDNPTIPFPDFGLGAAFMFEVLDGLYVSGAVADAQADRRETGFNTAFHGEDHFFGIWEVGLVRQFAGRTGPLPGAYRVGLWYDPQEKPKHDGGTKRDDLGFYVSLDQMVMRENADDSQGLGIFARYGVADDEVSEVQQFFSAGFQYQGPVPARDEDVLGFGVAAGKLAEDAGFRRQQTIVGELYYKVRISPWLHVSPSVQYVSNPGGGARADHATVIGVRVQIAF